MAQLSYRRHRFPPEIIQHAIWLYLRFTLSYRDVEELLLGREGNPRLPSPDKHRSCVLRQGRILLHAVSLDIVLGWTL
jgi:hypothetical protein